MNQYTQAHKVKHAAPEGAEPVDWERLTEYYFGEVQRLRAAMKKAGHCLDIGYSKESVSTMLREAVNPVSD